MSDTPPVLLQQQGLSAVALPSGVTQVTSPVRPPRSLTEQLSNFDPEVFDLSPESILARFAKALLGDAGAGRITKAYFLQRLRAGLGGAHFWDLDSFYGALFNLWRLTPELPTSDPQTTNLTDAEWSEVAAQDDAYRSRIAQFARALAYGAATVGMQLVAEAILSVPCDVYEGWVQADEGAGTLRNHFVVVPHRTITAEESYALTTVLRKLMPVGTECEVNPAGVATTTEVPIRGASADSEYWTIQSTDLTNAALPAQRPPFTSYQGEAWSHLSSLLSIAGYGTSSTGVITANLQDVIAVRATNPTGWRDLLNLPFPVNLGLTTLRQILAGRSVSDGICVVHPYFNISPTTSPLFLYMSYWFYAMPTASPVPSLVPIQVDAYPLNAMSGSKPLDIVQYGQRYWDFWATPSRVPGDSYTESMEIRLKKPVLTNYVSFLVAHYPQHVEFQAWIDGNWATLMEYDVRDSMPSRLPSYDRTAEHLRTHPQHYLEGHWLPIAGRVAHVRSDRYRVNLTRIDGGGPVNEHGALVPYSLGIKGFDVGYRITAESDIPLPGESPDGVFAEMLNVAGDTVALSVYREPAENLLAEDGIWRSNPMPVNNAVVNLYLDLRDSEGNSQVIDRLYLEPVKSGCTFNIYWSDDTGAGDFDSPTDDLAIVEVGEVTHTLYGLDVQEAQSNVSLAVPDNEVFQSFQPWWLAMRVRPHTPHSGSLATDLLHFGYSSAVSLLDDGAGGIGLTIDGVSHPMFVFPFAAESELVIFVGYDGAGNVTLSMGSTIGGRGSIVSSTVAVDTTLGVEDLLFPSDVSDAQPVLLEALALVIDGDFPDFGDLLSDLDDWCVRQPVGSLIQDHTRNALVRFHPSLYDQDRSGSTGFQGGREGFEGSLAWTPVNRDYVLTKGWVDIPQVKARWLNLEFSNLIAEPMETFVPTQQTVRSFPSWTPHWTRQTDDAAHSWPGLQRAIYQSMGTSYRDSATSLAVLNEYQARQAIYKSGTYRPTAAVVPDDLSTYDGLAKRGDFYRYKVWQPGVTMPQWTHVGQHPYDTYASFSTEKLGFFVGLKSLAAARYDYTADDNTVIYREHFNDNANMVAGGTWDIQDGYLESVAGLDSQVESVTYASFDEVEAVQFATQQSEAPQILSNDQFRTKDTSFFAAFDDPNTWHAVGDGHLLYNPTDATIVIDRDTTDYNPGPRTAGAFGASIVGPPMRPVFAYTEGSGYHPLPQTTGGMASAPAVPSEKGSLRAVARVVGVSSSSNPLHLQIIGSDGETVLAEATRVVNAGQTVEWGVTYEVGRFNRVNEPSYVWRQAVGGLMPWPLNPSTPATPVADPPQPVLDAYVTVRVIQEGASTDSWKVERISLFDASIVWEFSVDGGTTWIAASGEVRNNPTGIVAFPEPGNALKWRVTAYRPHAIVSGLQIRPWYKARYVAPMGIPYRGPNVSAFETEPAIGDDPMFLAWHDIAPSWWWETRGALNLFTPIGSQPISGPDSTFVGMVVVDGVDAPADGTATLLSFYRTVNESVALSDLVSVQESFARSIDDEGTLDDDFAVATYLFDERAWFHSPMWGLN